MNTLMVESVWRFVEPSPVFFDLILAMKTTFIILAFFFPYHLEGFGFTFLRDNMVNNGVTT